MKAALRLPPGPRLLPHLAVTAALAACLYYVVLKAWVAEDAYITFRVIDNFVHGYGLRWNVSERVQVYTHPLWMLLHIPFYALWKNIFLITIALGLLCSTGALIITWVTFRDRPWAVASLFLMPLIFSKAFLEYATSGLELPLSYLLFAAFGWVLLRYRGAHPWFWMSLITALAGLNRLDNLLVYLPLGLYFLSTQHRRIRWRQVWLGAAPLIAWLLFSLFYYGFLFPNTKYAKLNTGIGLDVYATQGLRYLLHLLLSDLSSFATLSIALLGATGYLGIKLRRSRAWDSADARLLALAAGLWLNALYIIAVGGDYMAGRFWAQPVFISAWLLAAAFAWLTVTPLYAALAALIVFSSHQATIQLRTERKQCTDCFPQTGHILNARNTFGNNALLRKGKQKIRLQPEYVFARQGRELREEKAHKVVTKPFVGLIGFYAGPEVTIVDTNALADPLLARLPAQAKSIHLVGHFGRKVPRGYVQALRFGTLDKMPPALAEYYSRLRLIVSGELWDLERLKTILLFNIGAYDHFRTDFLARRKRQQ